MTPRRSHVNDLQAAIFLTLIPDEVAQAINFAPTKEEKEFIIFREFLAMRERIMAELRMHADLLADAALWDVLEDPYEYY